MAEVVTSWDEPKAARAPVTLDGQGTPVVSSWDDGAPQGSALDRAAIAAEPYAVPALRTARAVASGYPLIEAGANLASGALLGFPAYIGGGVGTLAARAMGLTDEDPQEVAKRFSSAVTYQPQTEEGKYLSEMVNLPLTRLMELGEAGGHKVADITGSPIAGAATEGTIQMAPAIFGLLSPRGGAAAVPRKPVAEQLNEVRPIEEPKPTGQRFSAGPAPEVAPEPPPVVTEWTGAPSKESLLKAASDGVEMPGAGGVGTGTRAPEVVTEWKEAPAPQAAAELRPETLDVASGPDTNQKPELVEMNAGLNPKATVEAIKATPLGQKAVEFAGHIVDDLQMNLTPMSVGSASEHARATAKEFANQDRLARYQWGRFDDILKKNYTPEERSAMGRALDEQSVLEQTGQDTTGKGLSTLSPDQQGAIATINAHGRQLWERARAIGMVQGEGLPSYMPRMVVNIGEDGKVSRLPSRGAGTTGAFASPSGENIITTTPNLLKRKYLTPEETEAAAKEHFGEGATLVQDIRALPAALARFERAIAGRELIAKIKEAGTRSGRELVSETEKPGFFTVDHPAFKTYRPRFVTDESGKTVQMRDQNGNPVFDKVPLYVADEFKGPLKAIMSEKPGAAYNALMALKGKTMSLIMYSPLIHNEVEFGRAFALMPIEMSKIGLAKGFIPAPKIYLDGNRLKNNPAVMREAIANGLVPIGKRFGFQDITGIAEEPQVAPGRSITAKAVGGAVGIVNKAAGEAVKRGIDTAGDFWHNTLLWDRVGDLQMGLYGKFLERAREKGIPDEQAKILAAHFANRYAGVLPNEATSHAFRKAANFIFFSRSFTGGNIGAMKDAFLGAPRDVVAQLRAAGADEAAQASASELARTFAQRKAIGALVKDVALAHLGVALVMSASEYYHDRDFDKILEGYRDRWNRLLETAAKDPWDASNPFADLRALSPSSENEAGKEDRVRVGTQDDGTAIYMRLPFGKIGEEMEGYVTKPLDMLRRKVGTIMRPLIEVYMNDKGFGRQVYESDAKTLPAMMKSVVDSVAHIAADQFPVDSAAAAKDIVADMAAGREPKGMDQAKALGPLAGVTFSKGAPGGPAVGELFDVEKHHRQEVQRVQADVHKMIVNGEMEKAIEKMHEAHMTPREIATTIKYALNPAARLTSRRIGTFYQVAPEASQERMERLQESEAARGGIGLDKPPEAKAEAKPEPKAPKEIEFVVTERDKNGRVTKFKVNQPEAHP